MNALEILEIAPAKVRELETITWNYAKSIEAMRRQMGKIEAAILAQITRAVDENGKPTYSNETSRKARLSESLESHDEHKHLQTQLDEYAEKKDKSELDAEYYRNLQRNARAILLAGRLNTILTEVGI